jgi:hypothetical protein
MPEKPERPEKSEVPTGAQPEPRTPPPPRHERRRGDEETPSQSPGSQPVVNDKPRGSGGNP